MFIFCLLKDDTIIYITHRRFLRDEIHLHISVEIDLSTAFLMQFSLCFYFLEILSNQVQKVFHVQKF